MTFLLDENFPGSARQMLELRGHQVLCADLLGLRGAADADWVKEAIRRQAVILTTDRDFFHTLPHTFPEHGGVIVVALRKPSRAAILQRLDQFLDCVQLSSIPGRAFQLRDSTWIGYPALGNE